MGVIAIPNILREKLGDEGVDAFTTVIKEINLEARKEAIVIAEERFERRLSEETNKIRIELEKLRSEFKVDLEKNRTEIEKSKAELLKWMFIFWVSQVGVLSGIMFAMLKLFLQ